MTSDRVYILMFSFISFYSCITRKNKKELTTNFYNKNWEVVEIGPSSKGQFMKVNNILPVSFCIKKGLGYDNFYLLNNEGGCLTSSKIKKREWGKCYIRNNCSIIKKDSNTYNLWVTRGKDELIPGIDPVWNKVYFRDYLWSFLWQSKSEIFLQNDTLTITGKYFELGKYYPIKFKCVNRGKL